MLGKKRILVGRSWCKQGIRYWQRKGYEVIEELRVKYPVDFLCRIRDVNRSGYYKWWNRKGKLNRYEKDRILLTELLRKAHNEHPSRSYHHLAGDVFDQTGWMFSDIIAHQCCKNAGIHSKARKYTYKPPEEESQIFPNEVRGHWNATKPVKIVVSDLTVSKVGKMYWEWTILLGTFNNEFLAHSVADVPGSNKPYYDCLTVLNRLAGKQEEKKTR